MEKFFVRDMSGNDIHILNIKPGVDLFLPQPTSSLEAAVGLANDYKRSTGHDAMVVVMSCIYKTENQGDNRP